MLKTLHKTCAWLLVALGTVHAALTPMFYGRFSLGALWFLGSGLAMIFLGFLNITLGRSAGHDRLARALCYIANLLCTVFGFLLVTLDSEPQVIFGLVLIVLMTVTAFRVRETQG
jgi:MFS-type transporter involved in bile tolerance (Atg22 family)